MGSERIELPFSITLTPEEFDRMQAGLLPRDQDDRWVGFLSSDSLDFFRSWTGYQIYHLPVNRTADAAVVGPLFVVDDPQVYRRGEPETDLRLVQSLIDRMRG